MDRFLKPDVPELKIKDYKTYHAFHWGMVNQMYRDYGVASRQAVSSEALLFALLCDSLAGREGTRTNKRFLRNAFRRCEVLSQTQGIRLSTQVQAILLWHRLSDQIEYTANVFVKLKFSLFKLAFSRSYRKALDENGVAIEQLMLQSRAHGQALALAQCTDYEIAAEAYANMFSGLFLRCASDDSSWKPLQQFGYQLGRISFYVHSAQRYEHDKKRGVYNVFLQNGLTKEIAIETAKRQCNLAAVELARATALLNMQFNRSLLDNIIYLGLEEAVSHLCEPVSKKQSL